LTSKLTQISKHTKKIEKNIDPYESIISDFSILYMQNNFLYKPIEFMINNEINVKIGENIIINKEGCDLLDFDICEKFHILFETISERYFSKNIDLDCPWCIINSGNLHIVTDIFIHYKDDLLDVLHILSKNEALLMHTILEGYILNYI
jgi:hypothetical protein